MSFIRKSLKVPLSGIFEFVKIAPVLLPIFISVFGAIAVCLLLLDKLHNYLIWPIGLAIATLIIALIYKGYDDKWRPGSYKEQKLFDVLVLLGVVVWVLVGIRYASENIFIYRDPGTYAVTSEYVRESPTLRIDSSALGGVEGLGRSGAGFSTSLLDEKEFYAQGMHLLPVLVGLMGRLTSQETMLYLVPIFGGTALLSIYGFARFVMRPRWAALAVLVLSLSLPFIYFSRDVYTEPIAATFTFGALSLLWLAQSKRNLLYWAAAGLVAGAGTLTRIDAYLTLGALAVFLVFHIIISSDSKRSIKEAAVFTATASVVALLAWLDFTHLSSGYYHDLRPRFLLQLFTVVGAVVLGLATTAIAIKTNLFKWIDQNTKQWRGAVLFITVLLVAGFFVSRPLWLESHHDKKLPIVGGLQSQAGKPVEITRDYAERTAEWVAWYVGPIISIFGVLGIAIAIKRIANGKSLPLVPALFVVVATILVFFNRPSITPDQIWAARRLLPVILPGIVLFGAYALDSISKNKMLMNYRLLQQLWGVLLLLIIISPLQYSYPFLRSKLYGPQLSQIEQICTALPDKSAVIWIGVMSLTAPRTTEAFCDVPSMGATTGNIEDIDIEEVAQSLYAKGYTPVIGTDQHTLHTLPESSSTVLVSQIDYAKLPNTLYHPPLDVETLHRAVYMGLITQDGKIVSIE